MSPLLKLTDQGLYCPAGDFHIDPRRAVRNAVITHAHSDHARRGSKQYYCASLGIELLRGRLGPQIQVQPYSYREPFRMGPVTLSFHSAGHILGSSQVRIEYQGEVWVVSGDYKREFDPTCEPFEIVPCDTLVTEATFGTPYYVWPERTRPLGEEIYEWWQEASDRGRNCLLFGYSLGKAQRILGELAPHAHKPILIHDTMGLMTDCYRKTGVRLADTRLLSELSEKEPLEGELVLAPPSIRKTDWIRRMSTHETAFASGWMQGRGAPHSRGYDRGFVMSDHADWHALNQTILESGARRVFVQHRGDGSLVRHLKRQGIEAWPEEALAQSDWLGQASQLTLF